MSVGQDAMNEKRALRLTGSRSGCSGSAMTYGEKSPATSTSTRNRWDGLQHGRGRLDADDARAAGDRDAQAFRGDPVQARGHGLEERDAQDAVVGGVDLQEVDPVQVDERRRRGRRRRDEVGAALLVGAGRREDELAHCTLAKRSTRSSLSVRRR